MQAQVGPLKNLSQKPRPETEATVTATRRPVVMATHPPLKPPQPPKSSKNVSLWLAAIDIMHFSAFNGGVPACRSGRSSLLNCHATILDLICMGSSLECFVCGDPLRVNWGELVLCNGITFVDFFVHSEVTRVLQFLFTNFAHCMSWQLFSGDVVDAHNLSTFLIHLRQHRMSLSLSIVSLRGPSFLTCTTFLSF